jgi:hypothetical protein
MTHIKSSKVSVSPAAVQNGFTFSSAYTCERIQDTGHLLGIIKIAEKRRDADTHN